MSAPGRVASRTIGTLAFTSSEVRAVIDVIDATGLPGMLEPLMPTGGRPRHLTVRQLLVALLLLARSGQPSYLNKVPSVLNNLHPSSRHDLGLKSSVSYRQVRHLFEHVASCLDSSRNYSGADLDDDERDTRDQLLQEFLDRLLAATLPADSEYSSTGDLAFDATIVAANSRPEKTRKRKRIRAAVKRAIASGDPTTLEDMLTRDKELAEALGVPSWGEDPSGHREAVVRAKSDAKRAADRDATTLVYKGKLVHSYALHLATEIPSRDQVAARLAREADEAAARAEGRPATAPRPDPVPLVVRRMKVTPSTAAPGITGSHLLADLASSPVGARNNWRPADVVADRGYSNATPDKWHDPLRAAGYSLVHDLHPARRGHTSTVDGVVIIDGNAYSPGILNYPQLVNATPPPIGSTRAAWAAFFDVIELRRPFLLPAHGRPDPAASSARVACPALRGKLGCPVRGTVPLVISKGVPEVFTPPMAPLPTICTAKTVTLPTDVLAHAQDGGLLFGSRAWYDAYTRRRPRVEGTNGILKNPAGGHIEKMRLRVRGLARFSILAGFIVAANNIAAVDSWRAELARTHADNDRAAVARRSRRHARIRTRVGKATRGARAPAA